MAVAGSVTLTSSDLGGGYTKYSMAWVCSAGGAVAENPIEFKRGHIHQVKFMPDGGGTQPSDLYDVTLLDAISGGVDFLTGTGANVSNATRKIGVPQVGDGTTALQRVFHEGGNLYPTVANAGNAKGGTIVLIMGK
ncbi:MAG TPA: hypothetical protein VHZ78_08590 [Rhizomicrobium sp.]|jgi:hypothetical protein|nr:hypothetical protein [Rhizomicrobium sp.]